MNAIENDVLVFGRHDENTLKQIVTCLQTGASRAVLCADGHYGYNHPIGGVVALKDKISLSAVGFDIGCGNTAVRTNLRAADVTPDIERIMDEVFARVAFGVGRVNPKPVENAIFEDPLFSREPYRSLLQLARNQLGTVGSGNHYVDIFVDDNDYIWVGVHFGSRGLGYKIASYFLGLAGAVNNMDAPPCVIDANSELGQDYLAGMQLAGQYAEAGRQDVVNTVLDILDTTAVERVNNHHNYAWKETHFGEEYWVVRKGSTPAFPGQRGFVGGSMGDNAVILEGVDSDLSRRALYSTVHGAGRVMSRTAAKKSIAQEDMNAWVRSKGVTLRGAGLDESPQAYRRLSEVLAYQGETVRVIQTLRPIGVAMAGNNVVDPYKD